MRHCVSVFIMSLAAVLPVNTPADPTDRAVRDLVEIGFTVLERELIGDYYQDRYPRHEDGHAHKKGKAGKDGLPPGQAKKERLPPGLEKQLQRNGQLPPGLQKRALPGDLRSQLPPPRDGYERVIVDNDVLLVQVATGIIVDILTDIVFD